MTREQMTEKLVTDIMNLEGNEEAKDLVRAYYSSIYSFYEMRDVSIQVIPDGSVATHSYYEDQKLYPEEVYISSNESAKVIFDFIAKNIDKLRGLGATKIIVGIRSKDITQVGFSAPSYYYGSYSFSGTDEEGTIYWCVGAKGNVYAAQYKRKMAA
jgi:hypothetical protein